MHRQSLVDYGKPLQATEAPTPTPNGSEVLLRISHCGVCHSDLHLQDGYFDLGGGQKLDVRGNRPLPFTLGHEIAGTVEAVGPDAQGAIKGKRYAAYPWIGCGKCGLCARGDEHLCNAPRVLGVTVDGGYASHVLVPHPRYLLDVEGIAPEIAGASDVLGSYRLRCRQEGRSLSACRAADDRRARRRRHDGAAVRPRAHGQADLRCRHRSRQARGRPEARRGGGVRSGRCAECARRS